jgi:F0F1-type ATP synthase gamma subunit
MTISEIKKILSQYQDFKTIAESYTEIAAAKMQKIRVGIERNRKFYDEISLLYETLKQATRQKKIQLQPKPKQNLSILITSNFPFNGQIEKPVTDLFMKVEQSDLLVIGKTAVEYIKTTHPNLNFQSFFFHKDLPDPAEFDQIKQIISQYNFIFVYFSKMLNSFNQKPQILNLTQMVQKSSTIAKIDYIFEPEIYEMMVFFDSQILLSLIAQCFMEAELSRTAGRLIVMDQANNRSDDIIKEDHQKLATAFKNSADNSLLDMIVGVKGHFNGF